MSKSHHSTLRSKSLEQNLDRFDGYTSNNEPTSTSQNKTTPPTLRNVIENNGEIIDPFIKLQEQKNRKSINNADEGSSSLVESSSVLDNEVFNSIVESSSRSCEEASCGFEKSYSEITLSSRPSSTQKKNDPIAYDTNHIHFFKKIPKEVIRKILLEHVIDLNHIHATAKNLMKFANVSKFNREFVRELLTEERMRQVSFEITKSLMPDFLAMLVKDINTQFTQEDVDGIVHNWTYLTFDCSLQNNTLFTNNGIEVLKKIVLHPNLKGLRVIHTLPDKIIDWNEDYQAFNNNGLDIIYTLFSRGNSDQLNIDLIFNNWLPPFNSTDHLNHKSFKSLEEIKDSADRCSSIVLGEINLSRFVNTLGNVKIKKSLEEHLGSTSSKEFQFKFVKIMCNIALTHLAHSISLEGLNLSDRELGLIINEIQFYDQLSLQHLNLSGNQIGEVAFTNLITWLQSDKTRIKTLIINSRDLTHYELDLLHGELKNNQSLESIEIRINFDSSDHPITKDKRVKILYPEPVW
jgi:hypothetical protein